MTKPFKYAIIRFMKFTFIKTTILTATALLSIFAFSGCKTTDNKNIVPQQEEEQNPATMSLGERYMKNQANKVQEQAQQSNEPSTNGLGIADSKYEEIIRKSLVTTQNNYLVKQVLEKIRSGQEVIISAIGGSITEGAGPSSYTQGYVYQFKELFLQKYAVDKDKIKFIPAGIGGTPSIMGAIRYQKDVVEKGGRDPDLLIIEFAVNDFQECSNTRGMEYLVRNALEHNTAVIMLYAAATYVNQQAQISPIANYYKLPQVSISDGLFNSGVNQEKDAKVYYSDYVHPTRYGHAYMARCLMNLIDEIDNADTDEKYVLPDGYKNTNAFNTFTTVYSNTQDKKVLIQPGDFTNKDSAIQAYMHGGKCFPDNWMKATGEGQFKMTLNCKSLIMIYKNANNDTFGKADVFIDGKLYKTYAGHEEGGWNNCMVVMLIDEQSVAQHTVEIKMAQGDEEKAFTILAFGYAQ